MWKKKNRWKKPLSSKTQKQSWYPWVLLIGNMINRNSCRESSPVTLQFTMSGCRLMKTCSLSVCLGGNISQALCSRRPVTLNTVSKNVWITRVKSQEFGEENSNFSLVFVLPVLTTASPRYSGNTFLNYLLAEKTTTFFSFWTLKVFWDSRCACMGLPCPSCILQQELPFFLPLLCIMGQAIWKYRWCESTQRVLGKGPLRYMKRQGFRNVSKNQYAK